MCAPYALLRRMPIFCKEKIPPARALALSPITTSGRTRKAGTPGSTQRIERGGRQSPSFGSMDHSTEIGYTLVRGVHISGGCRPYPLLTNLSTKPGKTKLLKKTKSRLPCTRRRLLIIPGFFFTPKRRNQRPAPFQAPHLSLALVDRAKDATREGCRCLWEYCR